MNENIESEIVSEWISFANADLQAAELLAQSNALQFIEIICYHCHQSAEKYLKAYILQEGLGKVRTHDLRSLCDLCIKQDVEFEEIQRSAAYLSPMSTVTRYPHHQDITDGMMKVCIQSAKAIQNFVLLKIS